MSLFYDEWFSNPNWWFNATPSDDEYIKDKFEYLLEKENNKHLKPIERVIIYDQLPRHIYRNQNANHIIQFYLEEAILILNIENVEINSLEEWIFAQLPLRHTNELILIHTVMDDIWTKKEYLKLPLMRKFIKATYERCPKEQDLFVQEFDFTKARSLNKIIIDKSEKIFITFSNVIKDLNIKKAILSFSGGVDSMICSILLSNIPNIEWCAVHINYTNRETSDDEETFVMNWCKKLNIKLYVRRIDEINRGPCMEHELRDLYESYTRQVRYNSYKYVMDHMFSENVPIIMGHNFDDCLENILTNIAQQRNYTHLCGMSIDGGQDNIRFIRPLLNIKKSEIYDIANKYHIKHLPNSTPTWSQRGRIRDTVLPILNGWDSRIEVGLNKINLHMQELHECLEILVNNMIRDTKDNELILDEVPNKVLLWRMYIEKKFNIIASYKSIESFITRIKHIRNTSQMIPITQMLRLTIRCENQKYIIKFSLNPPK